MPPEMRSRDSEWDSPWWADSSAKRGGEVIALSGVRDICS